MSKGSKANLVFQYRIINQEVKDSKDFCFRNTVIQGSMSNAGANISVTEKQDKEYLHLFHDEYVQLLKRKLINNEDILGTKPQSLVAEKIRKQQQYEKLRKNRNNLDALDRQITRFNNEHHNIEQNSFPTALISSQRKLQTRGKAQLSKRMKTQTVQSYKHQSIKSIITEAKKPEEGNVLLNNGYMHEPIQRFRLYRMNPTFISHPL